MKLEEIPVMPGYVSVARAALILNMTKASVYYKIYEQNAFKTVFKLPGAGNDSRPILLLLESEVHQVAAKELELKGQTPRRDRLHAWNRRVKEWARASGHEVHSAGQPHRSLQMAYVAANPDDVRPE